jgi:hypothetical protein
MDLVEIPVGEPQEQPAECENARRWPEWSHEGVKARPFRYGWNGYENAYEESVDLCDECFVAWQEVGWN